MLKVNLRRVVYSCMFPKSRMGYCSPDINVRKLSWPTRHETSVHMFTDSVGSYSLAHSVKKDPYSVLLYEYWHRDWESSCFFSGTDPQLDLIEKMESWLGADPYPFQTLEAYETMETHSLSPCKKFGSYPRFFLIDGKGFWGFSSRLSKGRRQVSYVGEDFSFTYMQVLVTDSFWTNAWGVKSTSGGLWYRAGDLGTASLLKQSVIKMLIRSACVEHATSVLLGEDPYKWDSSTIKSTMDKSLLATSLDGWFELYSE